MTDFSNVAPFVQGSLRRLEELLRSHGFRKSEDLSPSLSGGLSSEIWLRREGDNYLAVRIDWLGHKHTPEAHYHFEAFPAQHRFQYEHALSIGTALRRSLGVNRFDPFTGRPSTIDPHARLVRDDT